MTPETDYERAAELIAQHPDLADFAGPRDEELVLAAERALGLRLPPAYRRFLRDFGAGSFGGQEIYGIVDADFESSGIPDAVWNTLTLRREDGLPGGLVAFYATGDGEQLCLRTGPSGEAPIVGFWPGDEGAGELEVVAPDFGSWLEEIVEAEIAESPAE